MADVPVSIFTSRKVRAGASPSIPSNAENEPVSPINPPGSGNAVPIEHNSTLNKDGGDPVNDFFGHVTEDELTDIQSIPSLSDSVDEIQSDLTDLENQVQGIEDGLGNLVSFVDDQTAKTEAEKAQARDNIDVYSKPVIENKIFIQKDQYVLKEW